MLVYFIAAFCLQAFLRVTISGFYATEKNGFAYILVYAEPLLLFFLLLLLPKLWDITGLWIASPLSQLFTSIIALGILAASSKSIEPADS